MPRGMQLGAFCRDGTLWLQHEGVEEKVMARQDVPLLGTHMLQNILPAMLCAALQGIPLQRICEATRDFQGVPHRMEMVGDALGMQFYNDSAASTPEAAMAAVDAHKETPMAIILGGGQKGVSLEELAKHVAHAPHVQHIILAGRDAALVLAEHLSDLPLHAQLHTVADFTGLPAVFHRIAQPGMHVVLSPGCTSFDLFRDYKARGEAFREVVRHL